MTVLVGIQGADFVVLSADSQITDGDSRIISIQTPKIVQVGDYLLGVTGESRPGDILTFQWKPPKYRGEHPVDFMGAKVVPSMYKVFKENGYELPLMTRKPHSNICLVLTDTYFQLVMTCRSTVVKEGFSQLVRVVTTLSVIYTVCDKRTSAQVYSALLPQREQLR